MLERPALLLALLLIAPVIVAFLVRARDRLATVPSTLLFRRVALSPLKNRRLREIVRVLALLACIAAVACLALAAAGPRMPGDERHVAIVVDVSGSMQGEAFEEARGALQRALRQRGGDERFAIVAAGPEPRHLIGPTLDGAALEIAVHELAPEGGEADLVAALRLAEGLVRDRRRARIWVVTDGGAAWVEDRFETALPVRVLRVGADRVNLGVTVLAARAPADAASDVEREVLVTVAASGGRDRRARVRLDADGVELGRRDLRVPAGGEAEASFRLRASAGRVLARVDPIDGAGDDLPGDDEAQLDVGTTRVPRVVLIARDDAPARFFVEQALRAAGVTELEVRGPARAPRRIDDGELAVVLAEAPSHRIAGPTLFLATTRGELPVRVAARLSSEDDATAVRSVDPHHVLSRGVDLDGAAIEAAIAIEADGAAGVVELDGGTVVATGGVGRDRWAYVGIDPAGSDLVLRVAFPVLIANGVQALMGASEVRTAATSSRPEVALIPSQTLRRAPTLASPWPIPLGASMLLGLLAAALLLTEAIAYRKGWAR